jgi:hypothetical protein
MSCSDAPRFGGAPLVFGARNDTQLIGHSAWALRVQRVRVGLHIGPAQIPQKTDDSSGKFSDAATGAISTTTAMPRKKIEPKPGAKSGLRNTFFFLVDDAGLALPFYNDGVATVMPEHAALAGRGVVFDRAYTAVSSCSPSRSAILSGLPNHQNGMYG